MSAASQAARVEQESSRAVGKLDAEVIADAFGQAMQRRGAQGQREIFSQAPDRFRFEVFLVRADHHRGLSRRRAGIRWPWR
jgi:hypothetical protein